MREVYLDNAATMTKIPEAIKVEAEFYELVNANPLRGLYKKSVQAETEVEACRKKLLKLARADESYTVIFTRGTTEALNLVASGLLRGSDGFGVVSKNSRVVVDIESHHSNILPFKQRYKNVIIAKKMDARELFAAEVISLTGVSNVTGKDFTKRIKKVRKMCPKAILGVDMAQMLCHTSVDLKALKIDFMAFSGHKFGAPMGIGGLVIKKELAEKLRPLFYGGEMVEAVSPEGKQSLAEIPERLEAGTLNVGGIYGLSRAVDFWLSRDILKEALKVSKIKEMAKKRLLKVPGVKVLASNGSILTFQMKDVHPHDVAQVLADSGISVRAGYLCAEPFLRYKGWGPVVRVSFSIFNNLEDVSRLVEAVSSVREKMGVKNVQ